jgi:hypothetical protein
MWSITKADSIDWVFPGLFLRHRYRRDLMIFDSQMSVPSMRSASTMLGAGPKTIYIPAAE